MKDLKSTYKLNLASFLAANVAIFWGALVMGRAPSSLPALIQSIDIESGILSLLAPIGTLVIGGLLSSDAKTRWVYWGYRDPLPGSRAFTQHIEQDARIDVEALKRKWGQLPAGPDQQNRLWYKMLKSKENDSGISQSHRYWLFSRDLTAYSVVFLIILTPGAWVVSDTLAAATYYTAFLLLQYVVLMFVSRNYGDRLVRNVLALASTDNIE